MKTDLDSLTDELYACISFLVNLGPDAADTEVSGIKAANTRFRMGLMKFKKELLPRLTLLAEDYNKKINPKKTNNDKTDQISGELPSGNRLGPQSTGKEFL